MGTEDANWHVMFRDQQHGPLSRAQVLEYLHDGRLQGGDLIWRPGFADWKLVNEIADFSQPPRRGSVAPPLLPGQTGQPERNDDRIDAFASPQIVAPSSRKWSIWGAANAGLIVTVFVLAVQIASGRGYELANLAQTASAETIASLLGQIIVAPLFFVIIALVVNAFKWRLPKSGARAIKSASVFVILLVSIGLLLAVYGQWFFSSTAQISGGIRDWTMNKIRSSCVQRQTSLRQGENPSDDLISMYCSCISIQISDNTTYKGLASDSTAPDAREYLKKQAEAAGQACRTRMQ